MSGNAKQSQIEMSNLAVDDVRHNATCERIEMNAAGWQGLLLRPGDPVRTHPRDGVIEHDAGWLLAQCDSADKRVLVLSNESGNAVPLFVHDGQVDFNFGEFTLGHVKVRRHVLVGNFSDLTGADWAGLFAALRQAIGPNAAVFLLGVVQDEPLDRTVVSGELTKRYFVMAHGNKYSRRLCTLGAHLDAYLASLPAKSRQDLKRSLRRFESNFAGRFEFRVYSNVDEVAEFLREVEPVSKRTYQARHLGLGITERGNVGTKVLEGAKRGYVRCFLLSVDGRPIAWRIGFMVRQVYCSHHIGYDPEFEKWHPGVVMHLHSIRYLTENCRDIELLDMLYGDNDFKRKASNLARQERNYYLFPRTARGAATYLTLMSCNWLSGLIGRTMESLGLKARIRAWLRRT